MAPELAIPPHSAESEHAVLGALLMDNDLWDQIGDVITGKDFYRGAHRKLYEVIEGLIGTGQQADLVTVAEALRGENRLDEVGGNQYIATLAERSIGGANIRKYARIVREKALLRALIRTCTEVTETALAGGADAVTALEEAERKIFELRQRRIEKKSVTFKQLLSKVFNSIDDRYNRHGEITGLSTGFKKIDTLTAGLQRGDLVIVAGRPSMGKTSFAMNIAEHVGLEKRLPVVVFSIEMADVQLVQRMLGSVGRIDQHRLRTGMLTDEDWGKANNAVSRLSDCPFVIEETVQLTIAELRARARRIAKDNPGLALVIIDYLQLMASSAHTQSERTQEIGEISRGLKALAKELDIPVMALSQLNRGVEQRVNKRPLNSDLRDSGSIEQDADLIVFLYRDSLYHAESDAEGYAEAIIGKQRNGATGTVYLRFVKEETRFEDSDWKPPIKQRRKKQGFTAEPEARQRADIDG